MDTSRQSAMSDWSQDALARAAVVVVGTGPVGTLVVWLLASMGVGRVFWVGGPVESGPLAAIRDWLLTGSPFTHCEVLPFEFLRPHAPLLDRAFGVVPAAVVACDEPQPDAGWFEYADGKGLPALAGGAAGGGWVTLDYGHTHGRDVRTTGRPVTAALAAAGVLADSVRRHLFKQPVADAPAARLGFTARLPRGPLTVALVGAGGIGAWAALAVVLDGGAAGVRLVAFDDDLVEASNLPRTGVYGAADVGRPKAEALRDFLRRFPGSVDARVERAGVEFAGTLAGLRRDGSPTVLLGAVDNAATRLELSAAATAAGVPFVNAGTSATAADVFAQSPAGPPLDELMRGQLTAAAARERDRMAAGGCAVTPSFVVPGVLAAAMLIHRAGTPADPAPMRWRSGLLSTFTGGDT